MNDKTLKEKISSAKNLSELAEILTTARDNSTDEYQAINNSNFMADLPVYSDNEPADTQGIYSWDDTHFLDGDWAICERDDI
jgi:hypothetical protein